MLEEVAGVDESAKLTISTWSLTQSCFPTIILVAIQETQKIELRRPFRPDDITVVGNSVVASGPIKDDRPGKGFDVQNGRG